MHTSFNNIDPHTPIATVTCVRTGKAMPFAREQASAINKAPIDGVMAVNFMGLIEDEQADRRHHGGPLKAVHQMPVETYEQINAQFGLKVRVGTLGENITTEAVAGMPSMTEDTVCIGDVFQFGDEYHYKDAQFAEEKQAVQLRIVQPRRPCYKINDQIGQYLGRDNIAAWITAQGIAGWYYQVARDGMIASGVPVYLIERPHPFATLKQLWALTNAKQKIAADIINPWLAINELDDSWKKVLAKKRH
ncbi:MOSC domain-containing protein [Psychrobacter sp. I-STPA10]|uniref:MOSC domain-containing protein n=1 Tax=Psychrobacter sp. I-STPA10 TaxID=2585769 RepID=UPI001E354899|nr:MOSC domain-containing protein [Psychrobacter sp. I-STPA10]